MLQNVELPFCIDLISLQTCTSNGLPTGSSILYHWEPCLPVMWLQPLRSLTRMAMVSLASLNLLMHLGISNRISMDIQILQIFFGCFFGASRWFCVFFLGGGGHFILQVLKALNSDSWDDASTNQLMSKADKNLGTNVVGHRWCA